MQEKVAGPFGKAVTLIVRMWQGPDGRVKASVKPADGGEVHHFPDIDALVRYLETREESFKLEGPDVTGLR